MGNNGYEADKRGMGQLSGVRDWYEVGTRQAQGAQDSYKVQETGMKQVQGTQGRQKGYKVGTRGRRCL